LYIKVLDTTICFAYNVIRTLNTIILDLYRYPVTTLLPWYYEMRTHENWDENIVASPSKSPSQITQITHSTMVLYNTLLDVNYDADSLLGNKNNTLKNSHIVIIRFISNRCIKS
jgi:hypothetical protein